MSVFVRRYTNFQGACFGNHAFDEFVGCLLANGNGHRQSHAAFARRAIGRADNIFDDLIHIRVRQDNAVVFRATHRLNALSVGRTSGIDILGNVRRADKADGLDVRMIEDCINDFLVAVHNVQNAFRRARLKEQLCEAHRHGRVFLGRLQDESVTASDRYTKHPHRYHGREVEWCDACRHAQWLTHGINVDTWASALSVFAFQEVRDAARKLDHLKAALNIAN